MGVEICCSRQPRTCQLWLDDSAYTQPPLGLYWFRFNFATQWLTSFPALLFKLQVLCHLPAPRLSLLLSHRYHSAAVSTFFSLLLAVLFAWFLDLSWS